MSTYVPQLKNKYEKTWIQEKINKRLRTNECGINIDNQVQYD